MNLEPAFTIPQIRAWLDGWRCVNGHGQAVASLSLESILALMECPHDGIAAWLERQTATRTQRDWPRGEGDDDNFINECVSCGLPFRGHFHQAGCRACAEAWNALTVEEQAEWLADMKWRKTK